MFTRPAHALNSGPERAQRAKVLKAEVATYLQNQRQTDRQQRQNAAQAAAEAQRIAREQAAAQAAASPKPMSQAEFVRSLRGAGR